MDHKTLSLKLHQKHHGKISMSPKVKIKTCRDLSWAYTPGVAAPCLAIAKNKNQSFELTSRRNIVAVISDGSAVLGLGNIGPEAGMPVMEGKAVLFKEFAGVDAWPIVLATQDTEEIIQTIKNIAPSFGGINLEDFSAPRCFEIEERLVRELDIPVMHDDQHGTAVVVLAALINALKLKKQKIGEVKIVINGVGAAGVAIAKLLLKMGAKNIILVDSRGTVFSCRGGLNAIKKMLAKVTNQKCSGEVYNPRSVRCQRCVRGGLADALRAADVFIGVSKAGILTSDMVKKMNKKPIVFAMANPEPEIMPDLARRAGAFIIATGRSDFPNQINNVLAFPGIFRGALDAGAKKITEKMKLAAALALAKYVKKITPENIIPSALDKKVAGVVSAAVRRAV